MSSVYLYLRKDRFESTPKLRGILNDKTRVGYGSQNTSRKRIQTVSESVLPPKAHEPTGISAKCEQTQTGHCQLAQKHNTRASTQPVTRAHYENVVTINTFQKHKKQFNTQEAVQLCEK
jgi:hypothetical protein